MGLQKEKKFLRKLKSNSQIKMNPLDLLSSSYSFKIIY